MKFKKIDFGRQANFILALILIHFVFFGYISEHYKKSIGEDILYLHKILFDPSAFLSFVILFAIVFIMAYRESFFEYGIRNSIWLTLFILGESWFWYIFVTFRLDVLAAIGRFFISYEGYLTIFSILATNLLAAITASIAKVKYEKYKVQTL
ncbi:MAG: hypothetical protein ACW98X_25470 [Promethearchaeota archaeon]|jgi:hypothetical protein